MTNAIDNTHVVCKHRCNGIRIRKTHMCNLQESIVSGAAEKSSGLVRPRMLLQKSAEDFREQEEGGETHMGFIERASFRRKQVELRGGLN